MNDDLEFSISQYLDGTLSAEDRLALERQIDSDTDARAMLDEYRRLNVALKSLPMPAVKWDVLANSISSAIDAASQAAEEEHARRYRMPTWIRSSLIPLAVAAALLVAATIGVQLFNSHSTSTPTGWPGPGPVAVNPSPVSSTYVAFQTDKATGPIEAEVAIGPSAAAKDDPIVVSYSEDVVSRPSHIAVASGVAPAHDTESAMSFDMQ